MCGLLCKTPLWRFRIDNGKFMRRASRHAIFAKNANFELNTRTMLLFVFVCSDYAFRMRCMMYASCWFTSISEYLRRTKPNDMPGQKRKGICESLLLPSHMSFRCVARGMRNKHVFTDLTSIPTCTCHYYVFKQ